MPQIPRFPGFSEDFANRFGSRKSQVQILSPRVENADSGDPAEGCCTCRCTGSCHLTAPFDRLSEIVSAWPHLPEHVRQTILTLIESVQDNESAT